jgi:hypothetical protein
MVIGIVKNLNQKGLVLGKRVAIDSSPITVKGKKYEKSGAFTKNGKYSIGPVTSSERKLSLQLINYVNNAIIHIIRI